jgi:hypothetical protein
MSTANLQQRLNDLFGYIRQGKIIEAMNEFYDKDTVMQENTHPPTKGLGANIEREKQFMSSVGGGNDRLHRHSFRRRRQRDLL